MEHPLLTQFAGQYTPTHLAQIEAAEKALLHLPEFTSEIALEIGNAIVAETANYEGEIMVQVIREADELPVYQFVGNSKAQRNLNYAAMKRAVVLKTGHCSLWALVKQLSEGGAEAVFEDAACLPVGGAFPLFVGGIHAATIATSGLHNGDDYRVVVGALAKLQGKPVPEFDGILV